LRPDRETRWGDVVVDVVTAEHQVRLAALRQRGVPVVCWHDGGPVDGAGVVSLLRRTARRRATRWVAP
jgi:hypothetical protein